MKRFKNMLLVSGEGPGERATLARAVALARRNRARLTLAEVVEGLPREIQMLITAAPPVDLLKMVVKDRRAALDARVAPLRDEGIRVSVVVLSGTPFLEIVRQVVRRKHDLVILTAEGKARLKQRLFGSTSLHLLRKCPCPVWVMKPTRRRRYSRINRTKWTPHARVKFLEILRTFKGVTTSRSPVRVLAAMKHISRGGFFPPRHGAHGQSRSCSATAGPPATETAI